MYHSRLHKLNEAFFNAWTEQMAYVLGFWFADGYMRIDKSYRISFASNDTQILADIQKAIQSTNPIKQERQTNCWTLTVHSKRLYQQLLLLDGHSGKSKTIQFPTIPKQFYRDFIRGYFDEDGSVFLITYRSSKNHKMRTELRSNFTSGCPSFLKEVTKFLHDEIGLTTKLLGMYNAGSSYKLSYGMKDTLTLLNYMYHTDYSIALERKAIFAQIFCSYSPPFSSDKISRFTFQNVLT